MHLDLSHVLMAPRAGTRRAKRIPPPAFLSRDLHCDWDLITTVPTNLLLIGRAPYAQAQDAIRREALPFVQEHLVGIRDRDHSCDDDARRAVPHGIALPAPDRASDQQPDQRGDKV